MIAFLDGPAAGQLLELRRAPLFLRVTQVDADGGEIAYDALDQLDDVPQSVEILFAYRLVGEAGWVRYQMAGPGGRGRQCRTIATGEYALVDPQPSDEVMRSNAQWQVWATEQARKTT